jgi:excisionase family DNA binding protein
MNETLTPKEAGLYLKVHVRTIYSLAKNGLIPALKVGRRWRFKKVALEEWLLADSAQRREREKSCEPQFQQNSRPTAGKPDSL